jgi:hypothetical protein
MKGNIWGLDVGAGIYYLCSGTGIGVLEYYFVAVRTRPQPELRVNGNYTRWGRIQPPNGKETFCRTKSRLTTVECKHCFVNEYIYISVMFSMKAEDDCLPRRYTV